MNDYAPEALAGLYNTVKAAVAAVEYGGITTDEYCCPNEYHHARDRLLLHEYSTSLADDTEGDGQAASAIDLLLPMDQLQRITGRLIEAAMAADERLWCLREFIGTTDGVTPSGLWVRERRWQHSLSVIDMNRLHLSFYRRYATDHACAQMVAAVMVNGDTEPIEADVQ